MQGFLSSGSLGFHCTKNRNQGIARKMLRHYHRIYSKTLAKTNAKNDAIIKILKGNEYIANNPDAPRIINWSRSDG